MAQSAVGGEGNEKLSQQVPPPDLRFVRGHNNAGAGAGG
jgi:hypothetical protein